MSDKAMQKQLSEVINTVSTNKAVLDEVKADNKMVIELLNTIYQRVEDISKKFDEVLNSGLKKPKTAVVKPPVKKVDTKVVPKKKTAVAKPATDTEEAPKQVNNIMAYFKQQYRLDPTVFESLLEENQAETLFEENKTEIEEKKEGVAREKCKANLLYKNLSASQKKKLKAKMIDDHDAKTANNDDDVEEEPQSD